MLLQHHHQKMVTPLLLLLLLLRLSSGETPACRSAYLTGGAPGVLSSPFCPHWSPHPHPPPSLCDISTHRGRRRFQEDRALCAHLRFPFLSTHGVNDVTVTVVAVFDGHNGDEASDMAARLLVEYFVVHVFFMLDGVYEGVFGRRLMIGRGGEDSQRFKFTFSAIFDDAFYLEILKKSLLRTVHDIDATFSKEASIKNLNSGSTATVVLITGGQILTANVGDSKALLCPENIHTVIDEKGIWSKLNRRRSYQSAESPSKDNWDAMLSNSDGGENYVKELTKDHHPDRDDEKNRIEAAGGYVIEWAGVLRVNGELAVSRAIGDILFKKYGVISTPEVTDWHFLSSYENYLVAASDGIFEKMTAAEVCGMLGDDKIRDTLNSDFTPMITGSLAERIVNAAFERGSMDNMAVVVLPLRSSDISGISVEEDWVIERTSMGSDSDQPQGIQKKLPENVIPTSLIQMDYFKQMTSKFNRMLVDTQYRGLGCFYLSENLNENMDYVVRAPKNYRRDEMHDLYHSSESLSSYHGQTYLDLYNDQERCWHVGFHNGDKGYCISPDVFAKFIGLLDSVPYSGSTSNSSESSGNKFTDFRYVLRRRFDRGSYGEVWLGYHWNWSQESDVLNKMHQNVSDLSSGRHFDPWECYRDLNVSSTQQNCTDPRYDSLFILKRIMVERGTSAYLSGLREKYFGETFLNASISLGELWGTGLLTACSVEARADPSTLVKKNASDVERGCSNATDSPEINFGTRRICSEGGLEHIARYVESFESASKEIWIVFQNEGMSLSKLIYKAEETTLLTGDEPNEQARNIRILRPSSWWHWLRTSEAGKKQMQNLIWQLLLALKSCHDRNITHRDIKPENMIVCFEDERTGRCLREIPKGEQHYHLRMRIIDFGSAIDEFTVKHLYGSGPARAEQTYEYTPPEALLNSSWFQAPKSVTLRYDMWSVGVVMLEMIIGSPHVFQISSRTRALLDKHLEGWSDHTKELAYKLRSYMEMCILIPGISPQHHPSGTKEHDGVSPASWKCSEESFSNQVKSRDPLNLGFPNVWALRLVRQLLVWHPEFTASCRHTAVLYLNAVLCAHQPRRLFT